MAVPESFEQIYAEHADAIYAFLVRMLGNHSDADDCFQAAWLAVHRNMDSAYREQGQLRAWLYRIVRNTALDELRRRRRRPNETPSDSLSGTQASPDETLAGNELATALASEIDGFSQKVRTAYHLRIEQGLSFKDMSSILDEPVDRLAGRVRLALKRLKTIAQRFQEAS